MKTANHTESYHEILPIVGYADKFSVQPGQEISFMISTTSTTYTSNIVKLLGGMTNTHNSDIPTKIIPTDFAGERTGRYQKTYSGSYAELSLPEYWLENEEFTVQLWAFPTTPSLGRKQTIWTAKTKENNSIAEITINEEGLLVFSINDGSDTSAIVQSAAPLEARAWYFITAQYSNRKAVATLYICRQNGWSNTNDRDVSATAANLDLKNATASRILLAANTIPESVDLTCQHFNGKIENPRFFDTALDANSIWDLFSGVETSGVNIKSLIADYHFGKEVSSNCLVDKSAGGHHGTLHRGPTRAVTSHSWTGEHIDYRFAPDHYAAVHFHDDDIVDADWEIDITWRIPEDLPSGVYALQLNAGNKTDYVPFFVRPPIGENTAPVLYLAPTNTYLAYANVRMYEGDKEWFKDVDLKLVEQDYYLSAHPELGNSVYDLHSDGSGVYYSSRLRPIMNIRPHYRNYNNGGDARHFAADLYITGWLENKSHGYDVVTDEDLDKDGIDLLRPYRVLITGSHPEYWTRSMMKAVKQYLEAGGRLMYLGGNGFYWVTSIDPTRSHLIEVRRGNSGTRTWDSPPGELHHSTTGEAGGLWRHHGFVPQRLLGVGFTAQGMGPGCGYKRLADSFLPEAQFIFNGVNADEPIGDFGLIMGGAVGDEVDRLDFDLGTPPQTLWLATSTGLNDNYHFVHEDQLMTLPGQSGNTHPLVRADMTYFDIHGGGAVFSVGSMNWAGSLAWNEYNNNVARISDNVLEKFINRSVDEVASNTQVEKQASPFK